MTHLPIAGISNFPIPSTPPRLSITEFNWGTLTAIVDRTTPQTFPFLLSNAHTLSAAGKQLRYVPPSVPHTSMQLHREALPIIGELSSIRFVGNYPFTYPHSWEQSYYVDAQLSNATLSKASLAALDLWRRVIKGPQNLVSVSPDQLKKAKPYLVYKIGNATGHRYGKILETNTSVRLSEAQVCANVICIQGWNPSKRRKTAFAQRGDSGALVYNEKHQVIGQLWGISTTDPSLAYASHIHPVLAAVGATTIY